MPDAKNDDGSGVDLVPKFIITNDNSADFPRQVCIELFPEPREFSEPVGRTCELCENFGGSLGRDGSQEIV